MNVTMYFYSNSHASLIQMPEVNTAKDAGIIAVKFLDDIEVPLHIITSIGKDYDSDEDVETWEVTATSGKYDLLIVINAENGDVLHYSSEVSDMVDNG